MTPTEKERSEYYRGVKSERKNTLAVALAVGLIALLVGGGGGFLVAGAINNGRLDENEQKLIDAYNLIRDKWLFGNDIEDLDSIAVEMMLNGLLDNDGDPYTFYTKDQASQGLDTTGLGFGVNFANYYGDLICRKVHYGTFKDAGIRDGDIITAYSKNGGNTRIVREVGYETAVKEMQGLDGDKFSVTVRRGETTMTFDSVPVGAYARETAWLVSDRIEEGKRLVEIRLDTFLGSPSIETRNILDTLLESGSIDTLLLDLKGNGGGYVGEMSALAKFFVPKGTTVFSMKDKSGRIFEADVQKNAPRYGAEKIKDVRIVQNGGSASASESFTMALKETDRAAVYGTRSFGKGIAQTFYNFKDGSVIRYTYAYICGPEGNSIHGRGIEPDYGTDQDYALYGYTPTVAEFSASSAVVAAQLSGYGYRGTVDEMLVEFQKSADTLTATGVYDEATYNYLSGINYDAYWAGYRAENSDILSE